MDERDHHSGGTSHLAFFVVVLLAFSFIALLGFVAMP